MSLIPLHVGLLLAQAAAKTDVTQVVMLKLGMFLLILLATFGLGSLIAQALRLKDYSFRIGSALFAIGFGLSPFINTALFEKNQDGTRKHAWEALKPGIDLAGGTNLVYQLAAKPTDSQAGLMDRMVGAIRKRLDPAGTKELVIRQVGADRIELIIPRATPEEIDRYKRLIDAQGSLAFHILANTEDHRTIIDDAQPLGQGKNLYRGTKLIAGWRTIAKGERVGGITRPLKNVTADGPTEEVLIVFGEDPKKWVTGDYLRHAEGGVGMEGPEVHFTFNSRGANLFATLTGNNLPKGDGFKRQLAIVLDNIVRSAPSINSVISSNGVITGRFTKAEVDELVGILNAGALDIPLKKAPIAENTISPTLGIDVQRSGLRAIITALACVFVFMVVFYRWIGVVADICLAMNLILLLGIMSIIEATLTLPGLAGIVLTVGMAVDANVLIYERMREELARGSSLRMAIHNGFARAFSSIFDSNITTLLTAVILYMIGTDQIKGFAVTLFIGIGLSMFTALVVNRMLLEIIERKHWLRKFSMMSLLSETKLDFVSKQWACITASLVVIGVGLAIFFSRGNASYDIDFTGGTMVTMQFVEPQNPDEVRTKLNAAFPEGMTLEQLVPGDAAEKGKHFRVRTTETNEDLVTEKVDKAFGDALRKVTMKIGDYAAIPPVDPEAKTDPDPQAGGREVELTFSSPVPADTMANMFAERLAEIRAPDGKGDESKYGTREAILGRIQMVGDAAETSEQKSTEVQRFSKMTLRADKDLVEADLQAALAKLQAKLGSTPIFEEVNSFESLVANEAKQNALLAMFLSLVMIIGYVWFRFENVYFGLAAVLALFHDVAATIAFCALASMLSIYVPGVANALLLTDFKMNLTMVAALMTIIGYSLNDTIVIFDRLREIRGKNPVITKEMLNLAINQTMSRTLLTAGTTFIVVGILYAIGGEGIHGFAFAMTIGVIVGTYSTVYIAAPFVLVLMNWGKEKASGVPRANPAPSRPVAAG